MYGLNSHRWSHYAGSYDLSCLDMKINHIELSYFPLVGVMYVLAVNDGAGNECYKEVEGIDDFFL